jgi:hypothetical protein
MFTGHDLDVDKLLGEQARHRCEPNVIDSLDHPGDTEQEPADEALCPRQPSRVRVGEFGLLVAGCSASGAQVRLERTSRRSRKASIRSANEAVTTSASHRLPAVIAKWRPHQDCVAWLASLRRKT